MKLSKRAKFGLFLWMVKSLFMVRFAPYIRMMKGYWCRAFGHDWSGFLSFDRDVMREAESCLRCGKYQWRVHRVRWRGWQVFDSFFNGVVVVVVAAWFVMTAIIVLSFLGEALADMLRLMVLAK